jgi:hypothetical protein
LNHFSSSSRIITLPRLQYMHNLLGYSAHCKVGRSIGESATASAHQSRQAVTLPLSDEQSSLSNDQSAQTAAATRQRRSHVTFFLFEMCFLAAR